MTEHTKEPWIAIEQDRGFHELIITTQARIDSSIGEICGMNIHYRNPMGEEQRANARRIVAAVNACAGISTEQLENPPNSTQLFAGIAGRLTSNNMKLRDDLSDVTAQRDQLLAALEAIIDLHDSARRGSDVAVAIGSARAAIAAVKGD